MNMREKIKKYIISFIPLPNPLRIVFRWWVSVVMMKMNSSLHKWVFIEGLL